MSLQLFPSCLWPCCRGLKILLPPQGTTLSTSVRQQVALAQGLNSSHLRTAQQADLTPYLVPILAPPFRKGTHSNTAQAHTNTCRSVGALNILRKQELMKSPNDRDLDNIQQKFICNTSCFHPFFPHSHMQEWSPLILDCMR